MGSVTGEVLSRRTEASPRSRSLDKPPFRRSGKNIGKRPSPWSSKTGFPKMGSRLSDESIVVNDGKRFPMIGIPLDRMRPPGMLPFR
jgi:hypothetical protein